MQARGIIEHADEGSHHSELDSVRQDPPCSEPAVQPPPFPSPAAPCPEPAAPPPTPAVDPTPVPVQAEVSALSAMQYGQTGGDGRGLSFGDPSVDPHNVRRFALRQAEDHSAALRQLRAGRKSGCWSWWIMPTPPFIKDGREVGTGMNREYAIRSDEEAKAYLSFGQLRQNYLEIMQAVADQLEAGTTPSSLLGIDVPRCEASVTFFRRMGEKAEDAKLSMLCERVQNLLASSDKGAKKRSLAGFPKRR